MKAALRLAGVLALGLSLGCAGARGLISPAGDYSAYRATRVAPTLDLRLAAAKHYLDQHPDGVFVADVNRWFNRAEPLYFNSKQGSIAGLEAYLRALPKGPHSVEAVSRLTELRSKRTAPGQVGLVGSAIERRLSHAASERAAVIADVGKWIARFLDPAAWRARLAEAPGELVVAWTLGLPTPVCAPLESPLASPLVGPAGARRCAKLVELPYTLPVGGVAEAREVTLEIAVVEHPDGRPRSVTIGGPDLFARMQEARSNTVVSAEETSGRVDAVSGAVALVTSELERRGPLGPDCKRPVVAPAVLDLACDGLRVLVTAGQDAADDTIVIERSSTPADPGSKPPAPPPP